MRQDYKLGLAMLLCLAGSTAAAQQYPADHHTYRAFRCGWTERCSWASSRAGDIWAAWPTGGRGERRRGGRHAWRCKRRRRPSGWLHDALTHIGQSTSVTLYRQLVYDPVGAFSTVGMIGEVPMTIVGRKDLPAKDARELIAFIRDQKQNVSFGNAGVGSATHLCGLLFMTALKAEMNVIPYRGSGPAMNDLLGGRIDVQCDQTTTTTGHIQGGTIKGYASTLKTRIPTLPDMPTLAESGLPDFELAVWYGLLVPKGAPRPIIERLASALQTATSDPTYSKRLSEFGVLPVKGERASSDGFAAYFRSEVEGGRRLSRLQALTPIECHLPH